MLQVQGSPRPSYRGTCYLSSLLSGTPSRHVIPHTPGEKLVYFPVILNRVVPHEAHLPLRAWRPFLKVTVFGEAISLVFFSFTQKALVMTYEALSRDIRGKVVFVRLP
jgi:hypothetical protein